MTERTFDLELNELREKVAYLAGITSRVLDTSSQLLTEQDLSLRPEIVRLEKESDLLENGIQEKASTLMARYQPVAVDLRFLLVSINIAHELERIPDQCLNLVQRLEEVRAFLPVKLPAELYEMVSRVKEMLTMAVEAYLQREDRLASQTISLDVFVDDLKTLVMNKYLDRVNKKEIDPALAVFFILLSRHLEKIGDLATNIAEEAYYLVRGEFIKHLLTSRSRL